MPQLLKSDIIRFLTSTSDEEQELFSLARRVKKDNVGKQVYLRGLIELSNVCEKDCFYCGIRHSNKNINHYHLTEKEAVEAIRFAYDSGMGSVAIQTGEMSNPAFVDKIERILKATMKLSNHQIGITLSCGEQSEETYRRWREAGALRYLLRVETSNPELYKKLHPQDGEHSFENRLEALHLLRKTGYQVGTGVMIGLPDQSVEDLAEDLLFMKNLDIDMCGMGPYIEHQDTPLYHHRNNLLPLNKRLNLSLKMIALLRILMPDINIAATTALQSIDANGRLRAIEYGANVLMPNITPKKYRDDYFLYQNKPLASQSDEDELKNLAHSLKSINHTIGLRAQGNSLRFGKR